MINYKLKCWKNKDPDYLKFIDNCTSLIPQMPGGRIDKVTHHHIFHSGGKHGNDYLSLPFTYWQHGFFNNGRPEQEVFDIYNIDPVLEIVNHLIKYCLTVLKINLQMPYLYNEDGIIRLIKTIKAVK